MLAATIINFDDHGFVVIEIDYFYQCAEWKGGVGRRQLFRVVYLTGTGSFSIEEFLIIAGCSFYAIRIGILNYCLWGIRFLRLLCLRGRLTSDT